MSRQPLISAGAGPCVTHRNVLDADRVLARHVLDDTVHLRAWRGRQRGGSAQTLTVRANRKHQRARRNGKRCGRRFMISLMSRTLGSDTVMVFGSDPCIGAASSAAARTTTAPLRLRAASPTAWRRLDAAVWRRTCAGAVARDRPLRGACTDWIAASGVKVHAAIGTEDAMLQPRGVRCELAEAEGSALRVWATVRELCERVPIPKK